MFPDQAQHYRERVQKLVLEKRLHDGVQLLCEEVGVEMVLLSSGRYRLLGSKRVLFVRLLGLSIMVRVGGGWQELRPFLLEHKAAHDALKRKLNLGEVDINDTYDNIHEHKPLVEANVREAHGLLTQGDLELGMHKVGRR